MRTTAHVRLPNQLGALVRTARLSRGWTQAALAERAGALPKTVSAIERGSGGARLDTLLALLAALELDLAVTPRARQTASVADVF